MSNPTRPLRIAVLEADHPLENTASEYGTYGGVFKSLLATAANSLGWDPEIDLNITKWDIERELHFPPTLDELDGILITGSRHNAFDNTRWIIALVNYIRDVLTTQKRVRVVGICFGHQIIARALGARVDRGENGWEASVCPVPLSARGRELFGVEMLNIFQMHRDVVCTLPPEVENLGTTEKCEIQGMYAPEKFISVQGHPEFTEEIVREILGVRREAGVFTEGEFEDMIGRVGKVQDGVLVATAFLKFLFEGLK
ncbi:class I glutamine amidotransferase-like protein [Wilcoxina mikolae CBS 423.85]|nr:class I glutamine amidotransferase-like protein [Wilcoxina mikolae CBS 423.85]